MELLIVDGYNIIHADPHLKTLLERDLASGREGLLAALTPLQDQERYQVVVVFDSSHQERQVATLEDVRGMEVAFTAGGQTADSFIEKLVRRRRSAAVVATDDRQLQSVVQGYGAVVKTSESLRAEMTDVTAEIDRQLDRLRQGSGMHRLDAQLEGELRDLLDEMRFRKRH